MITVSSADARFVCCCCVLISCIDNLYFTKNIGRQKLNKKKQKKCNNIELDSQNCHVQQTAIETAISNRENPEKSQIALVLAVNLFTRIGMRTLGNLNEK